MNPNAFRVVPEDRIKRLYAFFEMDDTPFSEEEHNAIIVESLARELARAISEKMAEFGKVKTENHLGFERDRTRYSIVIDVIVPKKSGDPSPTGGVSTFDEPASVVVQTSNESDS